MKTIEILQLVSFHLDDQTTLSSWHMYHRLELPNDWYMPSKNRDWLHALTFDKALQ
jgi:hypothetical protein